MINNPSSTQENELIEKSLQGDHAAYGKLMGLFYPSVIQVIYRLCGNVHQSDDLAQEVFMKIWMNLHLFTLNTSFRNWIFRVAVNASLDYLRHKQADTFSDKPWVKNVISGSDPEDLLIEKERYQVVQEAIETLPEAYRSVLVLREFSDCSYQEMADILTIPIGTVMSRLSHARLLMRRILKERILEMEFEYA